MIRKWGGYLVTMLIGFFLSGAMQAQNRYLTVVDQVDLSLLSAVKIVFLDKNESIIETGISDEKGRYDVPNSTKVEAIQFDHPGYLSQKISLQKLLNQHYRVFLASKTYDFEEVVFTANKFKEHKKDIPYQIEVIDQQDIQYRNPQTTADLLAQEGSIFVQKSQMGGGSPNLRGFEANKVLIVIDGVRMNNAIYRSGHLQNVITIDPGMIERTEIMFGPGSVMYGSDALGGVMHFYTRDPELGMKEKPLVKLNSSIRYGSANSEKTAHLDINLGWEKWGMISSFSVSDFNDLRAGSNRRAAYPDFGKRDSFLVHINGVDQAALIADSDFQIPTAYTQYDFFQKFLFVPNERISHSLNIQFSTSSDIPRYDRLTQLSDGKLRFASWYYGPQQRFMTSYKFKAFAPKAANSFYDQISLIGAYQDIEESRHDRLRDDPLLNHRIEDVKVLSLNLDIMKLLKGNHELAYGSEITGNFVQSNAHTENIFSGETGHLDTRYPGGGSEMRSLAAYFTHRWEINEEITLTNGIRWTDVALNSQLDESSIFPIPNNTIEQNSQALSGNLGLVVQPGDGWRMVALGATGFRAPNLDDVAKVFDSQPGNVVVPNPTLKPEYTYTAEFTLGKQVGDFIQIEATGFYTYYDNAIVVRDFMVNGQDSIPYQGVLSKVQANVNAGKAFLAGFTTQIKAEFGQLGLFHTLTYTYGQDTEADVPLDHIPPLFGKGMVQYKFRRFEGEANVMYNGWKRPDRYSPREEGDAVFATEDGWPSWWTLNLRGSYSINPKIQLQMGLDNVFDIHYRPFSSRISAPGRNLSITVRGKF